MHSVHAKKVHDVFLSGQAVIPIIVDVSRHGFSCAATTYKPVPVHYSITNDLLVGTQTESFCFSKAVDMVSVRSL